MSLTHQFLITLTLPTAFVVLLLYDLRTRRVRQYGPYWSLALLVAAVWSSSLLSNYGGVALPAEVAASWRIAASHLLTTLSVLVLLATMAYLNVPRLSRRLLLGVSVVFWLAALLLDPALWPFGMLVGSDMGNEIAQFNLWAAVWATASLLPLLAAIMFTRQAMREALSALYRNRIIYWQTALIFFTVGSGLALIQQPGQPAWQELGALAILVAAVLGTLTLVRSSLTNFRTAFRHLVARLAASLFLLVLTWLFLYLFITYTPFQSRSPSILELGLFSVVFTTLFIAVNRYVPRIVRRWLLPDGRSRSGDLAEQPSLTAALPDPASLGEVLLRLSQFNIATESAQLFLADMPDDDNGDVLLRPVACVGATASQEAIEFKRTSPVLAHLRHRPPAPLSSFELETLPAFAGATAEEKGRLQQGNVEVLMPLGAGDELVGLLALGEKYTGESYDHSDLAWLQDIGTHGGLLLWQAKELHQNLQYLEKTRNEMRALQREKESLRELLLLHERFTQLISPSLRQPFNDIHTTLESLQKFGDTNGAAQTIRNLTEQLARLRVALNNLIVSATRISRQHEVSFSDVDLAEIVEEAVRDLHAMALARHVTVTIKADAHLPPIPGDQKRLHEAIQHLVHNAIRFNKIGGCVDIEYGASGNELYVHVHDDGAGIPDERLAQIWQGAALMSRDEHNNANSGLGLILTQLIVRAHGGHVEAQSTPGTGSTFSLYLPLASAESYDTVIA